MERSESFSKRAYTAEMDSASTGIDTGILDLNDDCLFEVFQYLDWRDFGVIADVCDRLRHTAIAYFAYSKRDSLDLRAHGIFIEDVTLNRIILEASKFLRNFGQFIVRVRAGIMAVVIEDRQEYSRAIIELLSRYSSQICKELKLNIIIFQNDFTPSMRPIFEGLQKLTIENCLNIGMFLDKWPLWSAELRELRWNRMTKEPLHCFHRVFPKLTKISFELERSRYADVAEMLRYNPQLKEVDFQIHVPSLEIILQAIAQHIPGIESLSLSCTVSEPPKPINVRYFAHLKKLRSLTLDFSMGNSKWMIRIFFVPVLRAIGAASTSLKCLSLKCVDFDSVDDTFEFVDAISRNKQLETLDIRAVDGLNSFHLIRISKHCSEISTLRIAGRNPHTTPDDILMIIPYFSKLQELSIGRHGEKFNTRGHSGAALLRFCIDVKTFEKLVKIAEGRERPLTLRLHPWCYSMSVPSDLLKAHQKSLSIECSREFFRNANE